MTPLRSLFGSKKFITAIVGVIVALGAKYGLALDPEIIATIVGLFAVLVGAQGLADQGKEAAKAVACAHCGKLPTDPPAPSTPATVAVLALVVLGLGGSQLGCGTLKDSGKRLAGDVVDCMAPAIAGSVAELGPAFRDVVKNATADNGRVDWAPVKAVAAPLKSAGSQCAFAAVIAEVLRPKDKPGAPQSSALQADPVDVLTGFEAIRGDWGGAKYKLDSGTL